MYILTKIIYVEKYTSLFFIYHYNQEPWCKGEYEGCSKWIAYFYLEPGFITCDDTGKLLFVRFWKNLKQLFGQFNPLPLLLVSQQMWHPSIRNLSFKCFFKIRWTVESDMPTFRAISQTVNLASPSMISFILETISLRDADFGLPDFGAFLMDQTQISFSTAELCHKTHKKVQKQ